MSERITAVLNEIEAQAEANAPIGNTALELLQAVYRDRRNSLQMRVRAAALAINFESPKLAVVGYMAEDGSFAERLDRALTRSGMKPPPAPPKLIEYQPKSDEQQDG